MNEIKLNYWIELHHNFNANRSKWQWFWIIKARNGRVKATSKIYQKRSLCVNDANSFAEIAGLEVRT